MYLNKMSSVITNLSVIQKLAKDLVKARQLNYSQQCIPYYVSECKFMIENIDDIKNPSNYMLKSTLIRHRNQIANKQQQQVKNQQQSNANLDANINSKCIIYMHGLGSSRLEALPFVQYLPTQYCLFAFDFAGCGKSQGENITYGLREAQDINCIIDYLRTNKGIKQFILWGRSMGAVVTLLYAIQLAQKSKQSITAKAQLNRIKGLVIDSPFSDFRQITKQIGLKKVKIPQFLLDFALNFIQNSFMQLLKDSKRDNKVYNPFQIKIGQQNIDTKIPTVFLYSLADQVVPKQHSQKIIKSYRSLFDKIIMQTCSHNQSRPKDIIEKVFLSLNKFQSRTNNFRFSEGSSVPTLKRNNSMQLNQKGRGRRGISVQSKQKDKIVIIQSSMTEQSEEASKKYTNYNFLSYSSLKIEPKRQKVSCKVSQNPYMSQMSSTQQSNQSNQANMNSPLKIRLSNSFNKAQNSKISVSLQKKGQNLKAAVNNFYCALEYDNSILQKKLNKQKQLNDETSNYKTLQPKNNFKFRRNSQMNRKVEYQLNHTRYL